MSDVNRLIDHLFRQEAGRMTASLTRLFGPARIDLAEEVVQDALIRALRIWPYRGVPDNPAAWLQRTARNRALDILRRESLQRGKEDTIRAEGLCPAPSPAPDRVRFVFEVDDDQLRMIFTCCHPEIPPTARVPLTLKTLCGFSVAEIARAFLTSGPTISQRIVRAKRRIRSLDLPFEVPDRTSLESRLDSVLAVLYLMFNEGYASAGGTDLIRADLCGEAIRLGEMVAEHPSTRRPESEALLALMFMLGARASARIRDGELVLLADQDRSLWDGGMIARGLDRFRRSIAGDRVTRYHAEAAIACCHAKAPSFEETDWGEILRQYDLLMTISPSPVYALNRAVALSFVKGPKEGLEELAPLRSESALSSYYLLPSVSADFHRRLGSLDEAARDYRQALSMECSAPERRFLERRLREVTIRRAE